MISSLGFRSKDENHRQVPQRDELRCAHQISGAETPAFRHGEEAPSPLFVCPLRGGSADHNGLAPDALAGAPLQVAPLGVMIPSITL